MPFSVVASTATPPTMTGADSKAEIAPKCPTLSSSTTPLVNHTPLGCVPGWPPLNAGLAFGPVGAGFTRSLWPYNGAYPAMPPAFRLAPQHLYAQFPQAQVQALPEPSLHVQAQAVQSCMAAVVHGGDWRLGTYRLSPHVSLSRAKGQPDLAMEGDHEVYPQATGHTATQQHVFPNGGSAENSGSHKRLAFGRWSRQEHAKFIEGVHLFGSRAYARIARHVATRTAVQVRSHAQKIKLKMSRHEGRVEEARDANSSSSGHEFRKR